MQDDVNQVAAFFDTAIKELGGFEVPGRTRMLDFGCGAGQLVEALGRLGFDSYGCDIVCSWPQADSSSGKLRRICMDPYRLPFADNSFEVVVSTSVLEHAQNKAECFREIHRVLTPHGYAMHLFPGKWYLPYEPHIYVPLVNFFWPHCPKWWLALWARLGIRNEFQRNQTWQAVVAANHRYCQEGLSYLTTGQYRELSLMVFGNCDWPMQFYLEHASGAFARFFRGLPFKALSGALSRETRIGFLLQQKEV